VSTWDIPFMTYTITTRYAPGTAEYAAKLPPKSLLTVTTPDEARDAAWVAVDLSRKPWEREPVEFYEAANGLPESGGTIGPLPDGTVIEVTPA
jgi:hypothetical protein